MKLGLVTYNMAKDWDLSTIIAKLSAARFEAVELRTTHAHGVEPTLTAAQRAVVRAQFVQSPVKLWGLGTTCEYHAPDPAELREQIEDTKAFVDLARDVGAVGVKVRPNGFATEAGVPEEQTLRQIGESLHEVGGYAAQQGVEVWLEVHGHGTAHVPHIQAIMEIADQPQVGVCWNCNHADLLPDGTIGANFARVARWVRSVHTHDLFDEQYPWHEFVACLRSIGYDRYCLTEMPESSDPDRVLLYHAALWREFVR